MVHLRRHMNQKHFLGPLPKGHNDKYTFPISQCINKDMIIYDSYLSQSHIRV